MERVVSRKAGIFLLGNAASSSNRDYRSTSSALTARVHAKPGHLPQVFWMPKISAESAFH